MEGSGAAKRLKPNTELSGEATRPVIKSENDSEFEATNERTIEIANPADTVNKTKKTSNISTAEETAVSKTSSCKTGPGKVGGNTKQAGGVQKGSGKVDKSGTGRVECAATNHPNTRATFLQLSNFSDEHTGVITNLAQSLANTTASYKVTIANTFTAFADQVSASAEQH